jgi:hypothetical protein
MIPQVARETPSVQGGGDRHEGQAPVRHPQAVREANLFSPPFKEDMCGRGLA